MILIDVKMQMLTTLQCQIRVIQHFFGVVGGKLCDFQPAEPVESVDKYSHTNTEIHTDTQNCLYAQRQVNLLNKVFCIFVSFRGFCLQFSMQLHCV